MIRAATELAGALMVLGGFSYLAMRFWYFAKGEQRRIEHEEAATDHLQETRTH